MDSDDEEIYSAPNACEKLADFSKIVATFDAKPNKALPPVMPKKKTNSTVSPPINYIPVIPLKNKNIQNTPHPSTRNINLPLKYTENKNSGIENRQTKCDDLPPKASVKTNISDVNKTSSQINKFGHPLTPKNVSNVTASSSTNEPCSQYLPNIVNINGKTFKKVEFNKNLYSRQKCPKKPFMKPSNVDLLRFKSFITKKNATTEEDKSDLDDYEDCEEYYSDVK